MSQPTISAPPDPAAEVDARDGSVSRPLVLALAGLCFLVVAILIWVVFGRAPETVTGFGYIVPAGGYTEVGSTEAGVVQSVAVTPGQQVRVGEELVRLTLSDGTDSIESLRSPVDGIVTQVLAIPGRITVPGESLVYLQPDGAPLVVKGFVPATLAATIKVGMPVEVAPADAPRRAQYGVILGTVTAVSPTPVTPERISFVVGGNQSLVDYILSAGPVIEATGVLTQDPSTPSGYAWSIGEGPDITIKAGTVSEVTVVTRDTPVIGWFTQ
jgi:multidrug efflux pump subunit AcrA (membrane-fusion protein)